MISWVFKEKRGLDWKCVQMHPSPELRYLRTTGLGTVSSLTVIKSHDDQGDNVVRDNTQLGQVTTDAELLWS